MMTSPPFSSVLLQGAVGVVDVFFLLQGAWPGNVGRLGSFRPLPLIRRLSMVCLNSRSTFSSFLMIRRR